MGNFSYVKYRILKPRFYVKYRVLHIFFVSLDANWYESHVVRNNGIGIILVNTGSEVWAMVKSIESLRNENIEQYSNEETRKGAGYSNSQYSIEHEDTIGYSDPYDIDTIE